MQTSKRKIDMQCMTMRRNVKATIRILLRIFSKNTNLYLTAPLCTMGSLFVIALYHLKCGYILLNIIVHNAFTVCPCNAPISIGATSLQHPLKRIHSKFIDYLFFVNLVVPLLV